MQRLQVFDSRTRTPIDLAEFVADDHRLIRKFICGCRWLRISTTSIRTGRDTASQKQWNAWLRAQTLACLIPQTGYQINRRPERTPGMISADWPNAARHDVCAGVRKIGRCQLYLCQNRANLSAMEQLPCTSIEPHKFRVEVFPSLSSHTSPFKLPLLPEASCGSKN